MVWDVSPRLSVQSDGLRSFGSRSGSLRHHALPRSSGADPGRPLRGQDGVLVGAGEAAVQPLLRPPRGGVEEGRCLFLREGIICVIVIVGDGDLGIGKGEYTLGDVCLDD